MNETKNVDDLRNIHQHSPQWRWQHVFAFAHVYRNIADHLLLVSFAISNFLVLYIILGAVAYIYLTKCPLPINNKEEPRKRVLFVIAHPDDECMFFGPTILRLVVRSEVYLLCLSTGNRYVKSYVRKEELYRSCKVFGVSQSNITLMNNTIMPDNPDVIWNAESTARILHDYIERLSIDEVYTFDIRGVSGHLNHISIFYAFARMCLLENVPSDVKVYVLSSVNKLRKYSLFFDAALSALRRGKRLFIVPLMDSDKIREAMRQHQTQMLWYRAAYIYISRYMYINTYKEL